MQWCCCMGMGDRTGKSKSLKRYRFKDTCNDDIGIGCRKQQKLLFSTSDTSVIVTSVFKTIVFNINW